MIGKAVTADGKTMSGARSESRIQWNQVGAFVGLTYILTWILDLVLWRSYGLDSPVSVVFLQFQMLIPAFSAIVLQRYFFKDSPLYFRSYRGRARWFFNLYLFFCVLFLGLVASNFFLPGQSSTFNLLVQQIAMFGLIFTVVLRWRSGREAFAEVGLQGGSRRAWLVGIAAVLVYVFTAVGLDALFGLGTVPDISEMMARSGMSRLPTLTVSFLMTLLVGATGLWIAFGEEYGWRGYLQSQLLPLGKLRAMILIGLIWGLWHAPVILMGYNYPQHPLVGSLAFVVFNVQLAILLGYVVLKTGSIWLAALLHGMLNQSYAFLITFVHVPADKLFAFGPGLYGILLLAVLIPFLLRDPVWQD